MQIISVDCSEVTSEASFWQAYLAAANPEGANYFGRNLDAFWDALNGGPGWPGEVTLILVNTAHLKSIRDGRFYESLSEIARDSKSVHIRIE
jgi:ribonuclease inhibitor